MGSYLDRLHAEFDELQAGITTILERATEEDREVLEGEQAEVTRAEERQEVLQRSIDHYTAIEERNAKVAAARGRVASSGPRQTRPNPAEPVYDIAREFPTAGDYAVMLHRAWVKGDPTAIEQLERATAHQTTPDNPGLIPRPIIGPVIDTMRGARPFVSSIPNHPGPGVPKFDRPRVDQHVEVGLQAAEKDLTASQQMKINPVPVALETFAGHLNISKQDIRWTQPGILQLVFSSFARVYARRTEGKACTDFATDVTNTVPLGGWTIGDIDTFLTDGLIAVEADTDVLVDTLWMSRDVWAQLRRVRTAMDQPAYNLPLTGGGDVDGLLPVVAPQFPAGTLILGDNQFVEFWEELEGFLSVDEPNVLGLMVGYAGYTDTVTLEPGAFVAAELPPSP
jgi:HK97 family phage major capsid protein